ncbi:MAG: hypothetical protein N0E58_07975 [Candidatus Thiodiazotropha endolucinida]|uniref:Translation initiation factor IF-2 n=1 Tax=Candidatus Thiodiazotropha taylori TaxID=2792791 RepID=A0A9E4TTK6_9GAMM|nr:hypothetical protein [Candidatus Thiodiazotropha taylori]MCG7978058.1 hypothetical protein [Candidatus Thiodiazotropha taylori]MCW4236187.1 hypothetical protein [Candidatus Thiodiazotropha endolucinida]
MKSKIWLLISGTLLISTHLQADDSDYSNRQFNVNPGNMMGGMFNPMRNFFGGSNRYSDDYYNYRHAPPPGYHPGYGYPGAAYGYPPVYPGYQPQPHAGSQPANTPAQQTPTAAVDAKPPQAPPVSGYGSTVSDQPVYGEGFRFRPLNSGEQATDKTIPATTTGSTEIPTKVTPQSPAPLGYPAARQPAGQTAGTLGAQTMQQSYKPSQEAQYGTQESQMKFRPLDKPGFSE